MTQDPLRLVGNGSAIQRLREDIRSAARTDAKVLITGESGVGKEIVSRLIHAGGARGGYPLITVNCAAITETLLESELFGHERGSFTGAYRDRVGVLEMANRGTVFMDEIGETSPRMQSLLLRFLESGEIQRVGATRSNGRVDVRVIAATNRDLLSAVAAKAFREDLYYRLNVIHLTVPPLRVRVEDVALLLEYFMDLFSLEVLDAEAALCAGCLGAPLELSLAGERPRTEEPRGAADGSRLRNADIRGRSSVRDPDGAGLAGLGAGHTHLGGRVALSADHPGTAIVLGRRLRSLHVARPDA